MSTYTDKYALRDNELCACPLAGPLQLAEALACLVEDPCRPTDYREN